MDKSIRNMLIGLAVLVMLTPLGLLASGETFGEWGLGELGEKLGYVPQGMDDAGWSAPMPDYALPGEESGIGGVLSYVLSALIGISVCAGLLYVFGRKIARD